MIKIELPDGSIKEVEAGISGFELANQISHNLAKAALAVEIDGTLKDLTTPLTTNAKVKIITAKDKHGLEILRHSCSHVMSEAVKELWPDVQVTIGPFIEDGFYYDFSRKEPFTTEDFAKIEEKMHEIVKRDEKSPAKSSAAKMPLRCLSRAANITRLKLSKTCRRTRKFRFTARGITLTSAADRTFLQPDISAMPSS